MIIECPYCESKVNGKVIGTHESFAEEAPFPFRALLLECPACLEPLLGGQEQFQTGVDRYEWSEITRLWPKPRKRVDWNIPDVVRDSLEEARLCYKVGAYRACAVMCGCALEGICAEYGTKAETLANGLKELRDKKIIEGRLFEWGEELRKRRNIGSHATGEKITKEDARDLLDFVSAICDYVFVLSAKFENFMQRKAPKPNT